LWRLFYGNITSCSRSRPRAVEPVALSTVTADSTDRYIVVGVTPKQPLTVLRQAARFARHFQAALVCANVDPGSYVVAELPDGSVESRPIDPDQPKWNTATFDGGLASRIRSMADQEGVSVEFRELAGDVAHALGRLADVLDAEMIIVGSRRGGLRSSMHELFGGSVAAHLAHRQPRPVVLVSLPASEPERGRSEKTSS
jgi:nucleotide-binding universal stress UspA family protein